MNQYRYQPLPDNKAFFRLLTLLPISSPGSTEIQIILETLPIDDGATVQYEALSYTWGDVHHSATVRLGPSKNEVLHVTPNLAAALRHLQHDTRPRRLWVDAVCIDQANLEERSQQVLNMGSIYRNAYRVIVWIGPGNNETQRGLSVLRKLASHVEVNWYLKTMKPSAQATRSGDLSWSNGSILFPYDKQDFDSIHAVFQRSWFERLWIRQEIWLSSETAILTCGPDTLSWNDLRGAVFCLGQKRSLHEAHLREFRTRLELVWRLCDNAGFTPISDLLMDGSNSKCSDPRDRIFSILNMIDESERLIDYVPDYTKSTRAVYQGFVCRFMEKIQTLSLMTSCDLSNRQPGTPTWVPNWNAHNSTIRTGHQASGYSACSVSILDNDTLEVGGIQVATVKTSKPLMLQDFNLERVVLAIRDLAPTDLTARYPSGCSVFEGYCRALCADGFSMNFVPERDVRPKLDACRIALQKFLDHSCSMHSLTREDLRYVDNIWPHLRDNAFFESIEGYLGYGPLTVKAGDKVCVLLGLDELMILRPTGDDKHEVVGPAFLYGLMHAEGLLGSLPDSIEPVVAFAPAVKEYWGAFINRVTGAIQSEDPRKRALPNGWQKKRHAAEEWNDLYVNIHTGEDSREYDPRLRFDDLIDARVPMQKFLLV